MQFRILLLSLVSLASASSLLPKKENRCGPCMAPYRDGCVFICDRISASSIVEDPKKANRCGECAVPSNHGCVPICSPTKDIICPTGEYFDGEDCRDLNLSKQMQCHDGEIVVNRQCTPICNIQGGCNGPDYDVSDEE